MKKKSSGRTGVLPSTIAIFTGDGGTLVLLELNSDDAMEAILNDKCSLPPTGLSTIIDVFYLRLRTIKRPQIQF